ncbi:hypothetical protein Ancab_017409 [Ancistrocladus abbreviatus]
MVLSIEAGGGAEIGKNYLPEPNEPCICHAKVTGTPHWFRESNTILALQSAKSGGGPQPQCSSSGGSKGNSLFSCWVGLLLHRNLPKLSTTSSVSGGSSREKEILGSPVLVNFLRFFRLDVIVLIEFVLRMCMECGIPKTYSSTRGMICPVCIDRPPSQDHGKKKGSTIKDKEKIKRMRGQSSHAT